MYLGTPFLTNFRRHGSTYDEKSQKWGYFLLFKGIDYFYPFIHSNSPNRLSRIDRLQNTLAKMEKKKEMLKFDENLLKCKFEKEISEISQKLKSCCYEDPNAFWHIHKHEVELPLKNEFHGRLRRSKAITMNSEQLRYCKEEIKSLLQKGLIRKSHSPIACFGFYVNNNHL